MLQHKFVTFVTSLYFFNLDDSKFNNMKHLLSWFATRRQETRNKKQETRTFERGLFWKTIILLSFLTNTTPSFAQPPSCSYTVHNPGPCAIVVQVTYYDNTNSLCLPIQTQTIAAYSDATYNCGSCTPTLSNILVDFQDLNGTSITGGTVDVNNPNVNGSANGSNCSPGNTFTMSWLYNECFIGY